MRSWKDKKDGNNDNNERQNSLRKTSVPFQLDRTNHNQGQQEHLTSTSHLSNQLLHREEQPTRQQHVLHATTNTISSSTTITRTTKDDDDYDGDEETTKKQQKHHHYYHHQNYSFTDYNNLTENCILPSSNSSKVAVTPGSSSLSLPSSSCSLAPSKSSTSFQIDTSRSSTHSTIRLKGNSSNIDSNQTTTTTTTTTNTNTASTSASSSSLYSLLPSPFSFHQHNRNYNNHHYSTSNGVVLHELNYGFYCPSVSSFLPDESISLLEYFRDRLFDISYDFCLDCFRKSIILLEFRHKERSSDILIMSTSTSASNANPTTLSSKKKKNRSKLLVAINNGNVEKIIKLLVKIDPNFIDEATGETPLTIVASDTTLLSTTIQRMIVTLVNGGALIDFRSRDGSTPIHKAVGKSNYVALKTLLDLGGSVNYRDASGLTPLYHSIIHSSNPKITQLLLYERSIIGITDHQGWQETHHACKLGLASHLEQLLFYGCDINAKIEHGSGNTPLHVAAIYDQRECVRSLLLRGCDTTTVNNSHQTAQQVAVIAGNLSIAALIENRRPEHVVSFKGTPKFNPNSRSSARTTLVHEQPTKQKQKKVCDVTQIDSGTDREEVSCSSPCPSQRSESCSISIQDSSSSSGASSSSVSSSSGVCELDHSSQSESTSTEINNALTENHVNSNVVPLNSFRGIFPLIRIEGRREQKLIAGCTTLPTRGRRAGVVRTLATTDAMGGFGSCLILSTSRSQSNNNINHTMNESTPTEDRLSNLFTLKVSYNEKSVTLNRGNQGFGFILRGAKTPATTSSYNDNQTNKNQQPSLQYFDEIEDGGIAHVAGLRKGDFVLSVNGIDVRSKPHEEVVAIIKSSGPTVTMSIATPVYVLINVSHKEAIDDSGEGASKSITTTLSQHDVNSSSNESAIVCSSSSCHQEMLRGPQNITIFYSLTL